MISAIQVVKMTGLVMLFVFVILGTFAVPWQAALESELAAYQHELAAEKQRAQTAVAGKSQINPRQQSLLWFVWCVW